MASLSLKIIKPHLPILANSSKSQTPKITKPAMSTSQNNISPKLTATQTFNDLEGEFFNEEISCRLIHFWEARNHTRGNILMGLELLLIDEKSTTIQAFIPANRIGRFENLLKPNSVYKVKRFIVSPSKKVFQVSDHKKGICFTNQTSMDEVTNGDKEIDFQKFRTRLYNEFAAIVDTNIDLFDVVGQIRLITGNNLQDVTSNAEAPTIANAKVKDRVFLHLLMRDGETIQVYLWDAIATKFRERWNESETKPSVLLLTTVNPKFVGTVRLNSTSSTRCFFDNEVDETTEFITWLSEQGPSLASSSSVITKIETVTLKELNEFIENQTPQAISFQCVATIVDILHEKGWNYISCTSCNTKLEKTGTSTVCVSCKKNNKVGVLRYRFEITVSDENKDVATFVIFDRDGEDFAGIRAAEAMPNDLPQGDEPQDPQEHTHKTPQCLLDIVGRTCKFQVKLTDYNFRTSRQTFTVSRVIEDNIDIHPQSKKEELETEEPQPNTSVTLGKTKKKDKSLETEESSKKKHEKRQRTNK